MRRLTVRRTPLADLTPDDLANLAGGVTGLVCVTHECTGYYPTLHRPCVSDVRTVQDCIILIFTDTCV